MRSVVLHVFDYSLDGVIGKEDTEFFDYCRSVPDDPAHEQWLVDCLKQASLHVIGRVTYEGMAGFFPTATDPIAEVMNQASKVVFSRTLQTADWAGTTIVSGDTATEIDKLRRTGSGEIAVHGGASFAQEVARLDLVDEYRLHVFPYLAGSGPRLFPGHASGRRLELVSSTTFANGLEAMVYRRSR
jgi:dihydrofolate reductase